MKVTFNESLKNLEQLKVDKTFDDQWNTDEVLELVRQLKDTYEPDTYYELFLKASTGHQTLISAGTDEAHIAYSETDETMYYTDAEIEALGGQSWLDEMGLTKVPVEDYPVEDNEEMPVQTTSIEDTKVSFINKLFSQSKIPAETPEDHLNILEKLEKIKQREQKDLTVSIEDTDTSSQIIQELISYLEDSVAKMKSDGLYKRIDMDSWYSGWDNGFISGYEDILTYLEDK